MIKVINLNFKCFICNCNKRSVERVDDTAFDNVAISWVYNFDH